MKRWTFVVAIVFCLVSARAFGQEHGDFSILEMDQSVVDDLFVRGNDIYVKIDSAYWGDVFTVKISNENMADYRSWLSGEEEMTIMVYRSPKANRRGYTYRVNTTADYVEYWVQGRLVLHLGRAS